MELAERTAMDVTLTNVNASLAMGSARALLEGRAPAAPSIPVEMAGAPNFAGAHPGEQISELPRGQWALDSSRGELVYLPRWRRNLTVDDPEGALRFHLKLDGKIYKLVPTTTYSWQ